VRRWERSVAAFDVSKRVVFKDLDRALAKVLDSFEAENTSLERKPVSHRSTVSVSSPTTSTSVCSKKSLLEVMSLRRHLFQKCS
jgi:hypothetical protein